MRPQRLPAIAMAWALLLAGCSEGGNGARPIADTSVHFIESNSGMLKEGIPGMVMSFAVESQESDVRITSVEPVADTGLKVTYLGYSSCRRGCAGVSNWDEEGQQLVRNGLDGTLPIDLAADGPNAHPSLTLLLEPDEAGQQRIRERCLVVSGVWLTIGGRRLLATFGGRPVAGIESPNQPEGYESCGKLVHGQ